MRSPRGYFKKQGPKFERALDGLHGTAQQATQVVLKEIELKTEESMFKSNCQVSQLFRAGCVRRLGRLLHSLMKLPHFFEHGGRFVIFDFSIVIKPNRDLGQLRNAI